MSEKPIQPDPQDRTAGVYRLTCTMTGRFYVGSSKRVGRRAWTHLNHLAKGEHHSPLLQLDFNEHGCAAFQFVLLQQCREHELRAAEQAALDAVLGTPGCCNTSSVAVGFGVENIVAAAAGRAKSARWLEHAARFADAGKDPAAVQRRVAASLASEAFHENSRRQGEALRARLSKPVVATRLSDGDEQTFPSASAAARSIGAKTSSSISRMAACGGVAYGYRWRRPDVV